MADNVNRLLIVEEDAAVVDSVAKIAKHAGYAVASTASAAGFVQLLESFRPSLVMLAALPDGGGAALLESLAARACTSNLVLVGNAERFRTAALELGLTFAALETPIDFAELLTTLGRLLHQGSTLSADDLRRGIVSGELVPYYQPKVSLVEGRWVVDGVEALARWQHPRLGLILPSDFIPLAEQTGLIADLTSEMLNAALRQVHEWQEEGLELGCAVNLPPSVVTDLGFPDRVGALLAENDVHGSRLVLEITETAAIQNPTATMAILTSLRLKDVGLALDDFGTGFSSLTQLYQMPFSEMKIDKSLVMNVPLSREANTMVGSLIELGHNLGLEICAEGVENRAALEMLAVLGCDQAQGYFISRALPAAEIAAFASRWNDERERAPARARPQAAG
jgi:EAL domain-containing protein (putative c-di-GMP-specific phosphodiesterase class I)/CheY-like chemotaxis protein